MFKDKSNIIYLTTEHNGLEASNLSIDKWFLVEIYSDIIEVQNELIEKMKKEGKSDFDMEQERLRANRFSAKLQDLIGPQHVDLDGSLISYESIYIL